MFLASRNARTRALVAAVVIASAGPVMAENRNGSFTFSPFVGGQGFPFEATYHYDADLNWGFRAGYNFTPNVGTEIVFGQNNTVHDPEVARCTIWQYGADLVYHFKPERDLVFFVASGFGVFEVNFDDPGTLPDHTSPYFNYGAGLDYAMREWLDFRVDFRHAIMVDRGLQVFQGSVGLRFQF